MTPAEIEVLRAWFTSVDTDKSGAIDQRELSNMRMPGIGPFTGRILGLDAASRLITLFDRDQSGTIGEKKNSYNREMYSIHCNTNIGL